ncbi:Rossmann-fold NAD(P)-binding domain-containing protein [Sphingobacterium hungaricum]|uniref:GDP-L-fucose synthase n=1 Tax=Sphingobacterium hungaricum TaxID=2082723 RepID=A0A928UX52_9SPHI|nr:GDP-L-fucose synthase [Sphingobacterium hungaricum]MBE8714623.1 GDP-L-fucose synthase [Sphingobacterium hungaricum]
MKHILILGCGWVGEFAAKAWHKQGYKIWASTTTLEKHHRLSDEGVFSFMLDFDSDENPPAGFPEYFDAILVSVPASKKNSVDDIRNRFYHVKNFVTPLKYSKLIYLSSIGIYPNQTKTVSEFTYNESQLDPKLLVAEQIILTLSNSYLFRLGGLFGLNRIFAKYFENKVCTSGDEIANFIHLEDVFGLLHLAFEIPMRERIYNAVAPEHPLKKEVILASAKKYNFELPSAFENISSFKKNVSGTLLQNDLNYTFKYPSPLDF